MNLLNSCDACKELVFDSCEDLTLDIGLSVGVEYYWFIEDNRGQKFTGSSIVNGYGVLIIDKADVPAGLFSKYSDLITIQFSRDPNGVMPVVGLTIGYDTYDCLLISFI